MAISQIAALTAHISFLLWQPHIWQARSWQIYPPHQWKFHRFLLYPGSSYLADQVLADLPPHQMVISQIPVKFIFHSCSKSSSFGRPGPDRSTSHPMVILQILALTAQYSENLSFGWSTPPPIKWQFHRFLLWQLTTLRAQHLTDQVLADLCGDT